MADLHRVLHEEAGAAAWRPRHGARVSPLPGDGSRTGSMDRLLWLQRTAGNEAVSNLLRPRPPVVQRLVLLPFDKMDPTLVKFATTHGSGKFGEIIQSEGFDGKVKQDENILVVAHGNGVSVSNWDDNSHGEYKELQSGELATRLRKILPKGYRGTITLWACQSARPWRHIPEAAKQLREGHPEGETLETLLDTSYIQQLQLALRQRGRKLRNEQVEGPVGFLTTDRPMNSALVFADKALKFMGSTVKAADGGMIHVGSSPPEGFYDEDEEEGSDGEYTSEGSSEDEAMEVDETRPLVPQFRSKQEYLEYLTNLTPFGSNSQPPSLRERLEQRNGRSRSSTALHTTPQEPPL